MPLSAKYYGLFSAKKSLDSMSFLLLPQHEQFYREDLSVFVG